MKRLFSIPVLLEQIIPNHESHRVRKALDAISARKGHAYLVGGAVRDSILERPVKDVDIEVHGITLEDLQELLQFFGTVNLVGKSFGVLLWEHSAIEWVLPRCDLAGRKPHVDLNPHMAISDALKRRDLTINAMAIDLASGELYDPFGGYDDLCNKIARSPDSAFFTQDSLRFYRVMQFIGRFELTPTEELDRVCKTMDIRDISHERICAEFDKLFLKSKKPSLGLRWLGHIQRLAEVLPELSTTIGVLQEPRWHPEGDVFEHTMQAIDAAASLSYAHDEEKLTLVSAALCHDLGKVTTTKIEMDRIRSIGHEDEGVPFARALMRRITNNKNAYAQ